MTQQRNPEEPVDPRCHEALSRDAHAQAIYKMWFLENFEFAHEVHFFEALRIESLLIVPVLVLLVDIIIKVYLIHLKRAALHVYLQ